MNQLLDDSIIDEIQWDSNGLVPAIAQDATTGDVLMMAWMNRDALELCIQKNQAVYWSRSRQKIWFKGEQSGHVQEIKEIRIDCDADVVLLKVKQLGGIACHTGRKRCFYRVYKDGEWVTDEAVLKDPKSIYQ